MLHTLLSDRQRFLLLVLYLASKYTRERTGTPGWHVVPSRIRVMKLVFLLQKEAPEAVDGLLGDSLYVFEPSLHGPFSKDVSSDLEVLEKQGLIEVYTEPLDIYGMAVRYVYVITEKGVEVAETEMGRVPKDVVECIENLVKKYASIPVDALLNYVYKNYPEESTPVF